MSSRIFNNFKRFALFALSGLAMFAIQVIFSQPANATTYNVTTSSTCTLASAYLSVSSGSAVGSCPAPSAPNTINIGPGTYTLTGNLPPITPDGDLSIIGSGASSTIINGADLYTGINIGPDDSSHNYLVSNLTLERFVAVEGTGSVLASFKGNLTADRLIVRNNTCSDPLIPVCTIFSSNGGDSTFNITNSSIYDNFAGVLIASGNIAGATGTTILNMYNNTFSGNYGAPLLFENHPDGVNAIAYITNNTFANNNTPFTGAFVVNRQEPEPIDYNTATVNLKNNIFNGNYNNGEGIYTDANCPSGVYDLGPNANIVSLGGNISNDSTCSTWFNQTNDKNNSDSFLGLLTLDNGTYVRPLTSSSPAVGNAIANGAPSTDQRGVPRPQNGTYDSGAYELSFNNPSPNPVVPSNTGGSVLSGTGMDVRLLLLVSAFLIAFGFIFATKQTHHRKINKKNQQKR